MDLKTRLATLLPASALLVLACALATPALGGLEPLAPAATPTPEPARVGPAFDALMPAYDQARAALSVDRLGDLAQPARDLRRAIGTLGGGLSAESSGVPKEKLGEVRALLPALRKAADALVVAGTPAAARDAFGEISKALVTWRKLAGRGPDVAFCAMANRSWLQAPGTPLENPYGGKAMAGCGERLPS